MTLKINPQMMRLRAGTEILIATPGRLLDLIGQRAIRFDQLDCVVLDEADRMLDMGFDDDMAQLIKQCPPQRQTMLFSATYPEGIAKLAQQFMRTPHTVKVHSAVSQPKIEQRFYEVTRASRPAAPAPARAASPAPAKKRGGISAAGRARIAAAQRKRWADKKKAAKAPKAAPVKAKPARKPMSPEAREKLAALARERWAKAKAAGQSRLA